MTLSIIATGIENYAGFEDVFNDSKAYANWMKTCTDQSLLEPTRTDAQLAEFILKQSEMGFMHVCVKAGWKPSVKE